MIINLFYICDHEIPQDVIAEETHNSVTPDAQVAVVEGTYAIHVPNMICNQLI